MIELLVVMIKEIERTQRVTEGPFGSHMSAHAKTGQLY
jgi:hypothetical protein